MTDVKIIVAELAELFKKPFDNPFNVYLTNVIIGYRATILKQEYDKNGRYPIGSESSLVLPLTSVSPVECCCSEDLDCKVLRTKDKVPSAVRGNFKPDPFLYVGTSNGAVAFTYSQPHMIDNILTGGSKFLTNDVFYASYNNYIYTFNYDGGRLGVRDVFSNPLELLTLQNCDGNPCIDTVFIEEDMKRVIKQMVIEEFRSTGEAIEDQEVKINE